MDRRRASSRRPRFEAEAGDDRDAHLRRDAGGAVVRGGLRDSRNRLQVRSVELLEVELWRGGTRIGLLARRRELLPGRYTFGLTGRGPTGERLGRRAFTIRVVAYPGDGTRRQADTIEYRVR